MRNTAVAPLRFTAKRWGRVRLRGVERLPASGPVLVVPNHDSQWDPVVVAVALRGRRQLRFLARAELWRIPGLGQIPVERGAGDASAIEAAVAALREGAAVCVFPEGRLSQGETLRARRGISRLWAECPQTTIVLCSISGATTFVRFPSRPRVEVELFEPPGGQPQPGEDPQLLAT